MAEMSSITLVLKPQRSGTVPPWLGSATQAHFLHTLQKLHPDLSQIIHDAPGAKPFTSSTLIGARKHGEKVHLEPEHILRLRYTTIHPQLTSILHQGILPMWQDKTVSIHHQSLQVVDIQVGTDASHWVDACDYVELVNQASTYHKITLSFTTPTAFKRTEGFFAPLPQPELVFSSLLDRWNAFAPFRLPEWLYKTVNGYIAIEEAKIQTEKISFARGKKGIIPGFTGKVTYRLLCDETARRYVNALACFAKYSGVGVKTTVGLGQVRKVA